MPLMTTDLDVQRAALETIRNVPDLVPVAALTADADVGTITAHIDPAIVTRFSTGGMALFWDTLADYPSIQDDGEEELVIKSIDRTSGTITFGFTNCGYAGLQSGHAAGALLSTNLLDYIPSRIAPMLGKGDPVVICVVLQQTDLPFAQAGNMTRPVFSLHVEVRLATLQREGQKMDENVWTRRQQHKGRRALNAIASALMQNPHLVTERSSGAPRAVNFGDQTMNARAVRGWGKLVDDEMDVQQFVAAADFTVRGVQGTH